MFCAQVLQKPTGTAAHFIRHTATHKKLKLTESAGTFWLDELPRVRSI
jgi:hypothetical protein